MNASECRIKDLWASFALPTHIPSPGKLSQMPWSSPPDRILSDSRPTHGDHSRSLTSNESIQGRNSLQLLTCAPGLTNRANHRTSRSSAPPRLAAPSPSHLRFGGQRSRCAMRFLLDPAEHLVEPRASLRRQIGEVQSAIGELPVVRSGVRSRVPSSAAAVEACALRRGRGRSAAPGLRHRAAQNNVASCNCALRTPSRLSSCVSLRISRSRSSTIVSRSSVSVALARETGFDQPREIAGRRFQQKRLAALVRHLAVVLEVSRNLQHRTYRAPSRINASVINQY